MRTSLAEHTRTSLAEHTRKCLKVKYLGRIEYDFQKSCFIGPWDHKVSVSAKKVKKNFMLVYHETPGNPEKSLQYTYLGG
jgi:hypothetical protein